MNNKAEIQQFYTDVEALGLKFPVAAIAAKTGFSKSNVSVYLKRKKEPSVNFIKSFYRAFPKSDTKVPREIENVDFDTFLRVMIANFDELKRGHVDIMNQHKYGRAELRAFVTMSSMKDARNDPKRLEGIMETYDKLLSETLTANERTDKDHVDGR